MLNSLLWLVIRNRYQFPNILTNRCEVVVAPGVRVLSDMLLNHLDVLVAEVAHVESFSVSKGLHGFVLAP